MRIMSASPSLTRKKKKSGSKIGFLYLLPALIAYGYVVIVPTFQSLWFSFFKWNGITEAQWVGLNNYLGFLSNPLIKQAFSHTLVLIFFYSVLPISLGLLSAALISKTQIRFSGFFRSVIFLPQILTSVVIVVIWRQIFSTDGLLNDALQAVGLESLSQPWLGSFTFTLPVLGLAGSWTTMGLCMLLFISGTANISTELYDAAKLDGAGAVREFFSVTLPGLRPQLAVAMTLTLIAALRVFDLVWLTTRGGPGTSSITPSVLLYSKAFTQSDVGAGAAIGVLLAVLSLVVALVIVRVMDDKD
jgi:raffinose/stachyose/melibiose transport system permease protein